jgi:hypothetical protein
MKTIYFLFAVSLLALAGCSTMTTHQSTDAKPESETVMITYHVRFGNEPEFQKVLADAWQAYRGADLVFAEPHIIVREAGAEETRFVEIFTWVKPPDLAPDNVQALWKQEESMCEARDGRRAIEGGKVELLTGK